MKFEFNKLITSDKNIEEYFSIYNNNQPNSLGFS